MVGYYRVWRPLHGRQRRAGQASERGVPYGGHHARPLSRFHGTLVGASPPTRGPGCLWLRLVAVLRLRGGERLEEAGYIVAALVDAKVAQAPYGPRLSRFLGLRLRNDRIELEVLSVHRDVWGQSLQIQVTQVLLQKKKQTKWVKGYAQLKH